MIMQETGHSYASSDDRMARLFGGQQGDAACEAPASAQSSKSRLDRARFLLRETESRLAAAADAHAEQAQPSRRHSYSEQQEREEQEEQEEREERQRQEGQEGQEVAGRATAKRCISAGELALLRRFEQGGVHEIAASGIAAEGIDARSFGEVVPHAFLIFLAHRLLIAGRIPEAQINEAQVNEDQVAASLGHEASSEWVAWIGDRVHPDPHSLQMVPRLRNSVLTNSILTPPHCGERDFGHPRRDSHAIGALASRSIFVCDSELSFAPVRHGHLSRNARASGGRFRSGTVKRLQMDARACNRLWCAEQAIRMGAVRMVIVDGAGFSPLAWRRLQLAVDASVLAGQDAKPCVLVVTSSPDGRQSSGCAATARWLASVAAPGGNCDGRGGGRSGGWDDAAFAWRLRLMSARQFGLQSVAAVRVADAGANTGTKARTAVSDHGCIEISMPRSAAGERADFGWALVSARAAMRGAEDRAGIRAHVHGRHVHEIHMHEIHMHEIHVQERGVLATFVVGDGNDAPELEPGSTTQMACMDEGVQPWRARSA